MSNSTIATPRTAFQFFRQEHVEVLRAEGHSMDLSDLTPAVKKAFDTLTDTQKTHYLNLEAEDRKNCNSNDDSEVVQAFVGGLKGVYRLISKRGEQLSAEQELNDLVKKNCSRGSSVITESTEDVSGAGSLPHLKIPACGTQCPLGQHCLRTTHKVIGRISDFRYTSDETVMVFQHLMSIFKDCSSMEDVSKTNALLLERIKQLCCDWKEGDMDHAIRLQQPLIAKWLRAQDCLWSAQASCLIASTGDVDFLKWAIDNGCHVHADTFNFAVESERGVDMLDFAVKEGMQADVTKIIDDICGTAARFGKRDVLQWALDRYSNSPRSQWKGQIYRNLAFGKHWHALIEWVSSWNPQTSDEVEQMYFGAIEGGNTDVLDDLKALVLNKTLASLRVQHALCSTAAKWGHLDVLKWLRKKGFQWDYTTMGCAATCTDTDILAYTIDNKCPLNMHILYMATSIEVIKFIHRRFCPIHRRGDDFGVLGIGLGCFSANDMVRFAKLGNLEVVKYMYDKVQSLTPEMFSAAAAGGHIHVMEWLVDQQCPMKSSAACKAALAGHLYIVEWMIQRNRTLWDRSICTAAAKKGDLRMLKWATDQKLTWDKVEARMEAVKCKHVHVVEWIDSQHGGCKRKRESTPAADAEAVETRKKLMMNMLKPEL